MQLIMEVLHLYFNIFAQKCKRYYHAVNDKLETICKTTVQSDR